MSDDKDKSPSNPPEDTPPPPPPPVNLPTPDGFGDINRATNLARDKAKKEKKKKKNERRHPKDAYSGQLKQASSLGCGSLLLILIVLLALPLGGAYVWLNKLQTEYTTDGGFTLVKAQSKNIADAPAEKTVYVGTQVLYEVPETQHEVVFMGGAWWLSGTFYEKVTFHGAQLTLEPGSKFLKGLEVQAIKLDLGNAEIEGDVSGTILHQSASAAEE